jgi:hypothetical protein
MNENLQSGRGSILNPQSQFDSANNIPTGGNMTEQQVRNIVQDMMNKNYTSGKPQIPPHIHNDVDNLRISQKDVIPNIGFSGDITFANTAIYTLNFPVNNPTTVIFNGAARNGAKTIHALVNGSSYLSNAWAFQPLTNRSVQAGGIQYPIHGIPIQGCSSLLIDNASISNTVTRVDTNNIVFVQDINNNYMALMSIISLNKTSMQVNVTLASTWIIVGQFLIY